MRGGYPLPCGCFLAFRVIQVLPIQLLPLPQGRVFLLEFFYQRITVRQHLLQFFNYLELCLSALIQSQQLFVHPVQLLQKFVSFLFSALRSANTSSSDIDFSMEFIYKRDYRVLCFSNRNPKWNHLVVASAL